MAEAVLLTSPSVKKILFTLWAVCFGFSPTGAQPLTNQSVIDSLLNVTMDALVVPVCNDSTNVWYLDIRTGQEEEAALRKAFLGKMAGVNGTLRNDAPQRFVVEQLDVDVVYAENMTPHALEEGVIRTVRVKLTGVKKCPKQAQTLQPFVYQRGFMDTVTLGMIPQLESGARPYARGRLVRSGIWQKWLEPLLVTVSLSAVVYLFFSIRS
ncbi:MAG: hypothetical protein D6677_06230 [Calditrichaeota bacterium]|nr:MAG: hypothetical protein D6677_06230 [Calditrichota bacterium]